MTANRPLATVLLVVLVLLAGCWGGGGDDEPTNDVTLQNEDALHNSVSPQQPATVKAKVQGDSRDGVALKYRVYDRNGQQVATDRVEMYDDDGDDVYEGVVPGQKPGYRVKYKVVASYTDTSTNQTASGSYNVSNVKSVSAPTGRTTNETSYVTVTLYNASGVDSVTLDYQRTSNVDGTTERGSETVENVGAENVTFAVPNDDDTGSDANMTVSLSVTVTHAENQSFTRDVQSYTYVETEPADTLYIPIKFTSSQSAPDISKLGVRATKVDRYFYNQSGGTVHMSHQVYDEGPSDGYVVLPNATSYYINSTSNSYRAWKIINDAQEQVDDDVNRSKYDDVVYVLNETQGITVRSFAWGDGGKGVFTSTNAVENPYGDWAHELGHARFHWPDYYYFDKEWKSNGRMYLWGLMGGGGQSSAIEGRPPQVSIFHRLQEGWASEQRVNHSELPFEPDSKEVTLTDLHEQGGAVNYSLPSWATDSVFDYYLFAARDQRDVDNVPHSMAEVPGLRYPNQGDGDGIVVYGVTPQSDGAKSVHYVLNPSEENRDGDSRYDVRAVTLREGTDDVLFDPDAGIKVEAANSPEGTGTVSIARENYTNIEGVNVYLLLKDCETVENVTDQGECDALTEPSGSETEIYGTLRAETASGTVGYTANGSYVNDVNGSYYVSAGPVQKVYVPSNASAQFVVDPPNVTDSNVTVVTQTVSRGPDGNRTASDFRRETLAPNETVEPELARLATSTAGLNAGELRTLESKSLAFRVRNDGIRNLTNVTVTTDASWISVNRTDVGTVTAASGIGLGVTVDVPPGQPVGNYTFNVTVVGDGTKSVQRETVTVNVTVLPTVYWHATTDDRSLTLADTNTTATTTTVVNSPASNVPLRDIETTVTGNVTRFNVTTPRFVETLGPGERVNLTTTVKVPDGGIEEGTYHGTVTVDVLDEYGRYFEYSVPVDDDYVVPNETEDVTDVRVDAHGPSVNSTATFHPKKQVAMRKGAATQRVTVEPIVEEFDVPADRVAVSATIPEGWRFQSPKGRDVRDGDVTVWIVENAKQETKAGNGGNRHQLSADAYDLTVENGTVYVTIPDVTATEFGSHLTTDDALEIEFKLNKRAKADSYGYDSEVTVQTTSPQAIYRTERPVASVDVFDPTAGDEPGRVGDRPSRVPRNGVRAGAGIGRNATLKGGQLKSVDVDGEQTQWIRFGLVRDVSGDERHLWVRVGENATIDATVTDEGYVVLDGVVTRPLGVVFGEDLQRGREVTVQIPVENVTAGEVVFTASTGDTGDVAAVLAQDSSGWTLQLLPTSASDATTTPITVTVGPDVFERRNGDANRNSSSVDGRTIYIPEVQTGTN